MVRNPGADARLRTLIRADGWSGDATPGYGARGRTISVQTLAAASHDAETAGGTRLPFSLSIETDSNRRKPNICVAFSTQRDWR